MNSFTAVVLVALPFLGENSNPPELGRVRFPRDVDAALEVAQKENRPVFALFQEVPGCSTCTGFGRGPLSHPLVVEAIETLFVPVCVHNNAGGADAKALERFGEPSWNNPVVRFLDGRGQDVIARKDGVWSEAALVERMGEALVAAKVAIPRWFDLALLEARAAQSERAVFAMYCFWEGQARLGGLDGVLDATPGFFDGREVVDVRYDPRRIALRDLASAAAEFDCARDVYLPRAADVASLPELLRARGKVLEGDVRRAPDSDDLRSLKRVRALDLLPLTRAQAIRVNAELAAKNATRPGTLTPRQEALRARIANAKADVLSGLERPATAAKLGAHEDALRARLDRSPERDR